jgi:hypothetical protein
VGERSNIEQHLPGYTATSAQPGSQSVRKLRRRAREGYGVMNSEAAEVQRLFRTEQEGTRPPPHVIDIADITKGLPLTSDQHEVVHRLIQETRADYGAHSHLMIPRLASARTQLSNVINHMGIDSSARMEIQRRALAYWRRNGRTDYEGKPMARYVISKAQAAMPFHDPMLGFIKDEGDGPQPPSGAQGAGEEGGAEAGGKDGGKGGYNPVNMPPGAGAAGPGGPKKPKAPKPKIKGSQVDHEDGTTMMFGSVEANLHKDADYQHHATEYAKHRSMFEAHKDHDPETAEGHRHAANMHAKIANALHQAGQTQPHGARGQVDPTAQAADEGGEPDIFGGDAVGGHDPDPDAAHDDGMPPEGMPENPGGVPPGGPPEGQPGAPQAGPPPGQDAQGQPVPAQPDGQRNEPMSDSANKGKGGPFGKSRHYVPKVPPRSILPLFLIGE